MKEWAVRLLQRLLHVSEETAVNMLHVAGVTAAALTFVLAATFIVASEAFFTGGRSVGALQQGDIAQGNIHAPSSITYVSELLTQRARDEAAAKVTEVYDPPDPNVARRQTQLARQMLDFIQNVRRDSFATLDQKIGDLNHITDLLLHEDIVRTVLNMNEEVWQALGDQIIGVLESVMREPIRDADIALAKRQLPTQVSLRFSPEETEIIVAVVEDLLRPNTFPDPAATEAARQDARGRAEPVTRTFARNEIVIREGKVIDAVDYEALQQLGLLNSEGLQREQLTQAFLASALVVVVTGLYVARFTPELYENSRLVLLISTIFLLVLLAARIAGDSGQIYLLPVASMALLFASIVSPQVAVIAIIDLAFLVGLMFDNSLEMAVLITGGSLMGTLMLRRSERLNSFFLAGLFVGLANTVIVTLFRLGAASDITSLSPLVLFSLINGILSAATAIAGMYLITTLFNLPTSLKLSELSQPNHPLLQRLLREAPGTYQHSLQVANLSEQAAQAIGANAELVRVAALYHDIGKMLNPAFFTENQQFGGGNPHDALNDPYRSADIIISHVVEGDEMARQYRLPTRIRDFILEHHGTTQAYYFYSKAVELEGGDSSAVDISEFTYPGPRPQTRETAIMMIADSCEAVVRSRGPSSKQEISEIVEDIVDRKIHDGQLDESGLTLNDIKAIRAIFVEMLQALFHPRIHYPGAARPRGVDTPSQMALMIAKSDHGRVTQEVGVAHMPAENSSRRNDPHPSMDHEAAHPEVGESEADDFDGDTPLLEVPTLPRTGEFRRVDLNGSSAEKPSEPADTEESRDNQ